METERGPLRRQIAGGHEIEMRNNVGGAEWRHEQSLKTRQAVRLSGKAVMIAGMEQLNRNSEQPAASDAVSRRQYHCGVSNAAPPTSDTVRGPLLRLAVAKPVLPC